MRKFLLFATIVAAFSCTNEEGARGALEGMGYTHIELTGYSWNKCSDSDSTCTGFVARGPATMDERGRWHSGLTVRGAVGCSRTGCGKGCTVRITSTSRDQ